MELTLQGWTDNEIFNKMRGEHKCCKRSSLTLPKVKTVDDEPKDEIANKENIKRSNIEKLPEIRKSSSADNSEEIKQSCNGKDYYRGNKNQAKVKNSKKNKFVKRLSNGTVKRVVSEEVTNVDGSGENKLTPETTILRLTGGIELVPLLARRRRIGARTLPSSDVTRPPEQSCQYV